MKTAIKIINISLHILPLIIILLIPDCDRKILRQNCFNLQIFEYIIFRSPSSPEKSAKQKPRSTIAKEIYLTFPWKRYLGLLWSWWDAAENTHICECCHRSSIKNHWGKIQKLIGDHQYFNISPGLNYVM